MTRPSTGEFIAGPTAGMHYLQSSASGVGSSAGYEHWWGRNGLSVGYSRTPTDSTLISATERNVHWAPVLVNATLVSENGLDVKWKLTRTEFNAMYARRWRGKAKNSPYVLAGVTSILLDGGKASGLDHQFAPVAGAGNDLRISARLGLRCEFLANFLRASNYSDGTYLPGHTLMLETRAGLTWRFGHVKHE